MLLRACGVQWSITIRFMLVQWCNVECLPYAVWCSTGLWYVEHVSLLWFIGANRVRRALVAVMAAFKVRIVS